ncbi:MAG: RIP metalloprotease RseP [Bacteroidales bacterium]|nr:RIP metalloprotease RseP [Bacteroidales bacterium]
MIVLSKIIQLIFALSLLVLIHELGHFFFAKLFKIRVSHFYLFFNPKFSIMRVKKFGGKLHFKFFSKNPEMLEADADLSVLDDNDWRKYPENTEYGIGWIPLGGYCSVVGMIDETTGADKLSKEPQPWEFRTKPAWQRFLVMFGGVFFNFLLAFFLYGAILHTWGEEYLKNEDAKYGIAVNDLSYEIGFRNGDKILSFDGVPVDDFSQLQIDLIRSRASEALVLRGDDTVRIDIDPVYMPAMLNTPNMFQVAFPFVVDQVQDSSANFNSGLKHGDRIVAVNGEEMFIVQDIQEELTKHKNSSILAEIDRDGNRFTLPLAVDGEGHIGVLLQSDMTEYFNITKNEYSFFAAFPAGAKKGFTTIKNYVKELGLIFSPKTEAYKSVGSFIAIGRIFPGTWDWYRVWSITALFSIMLGVMNLIPIPGLDGGHILFIFVEILTGRKPSDRFLEVAQLIGMILLLALMVLAFGNDIRSLFD